MIEKGPGTAKKFKLPAGWPRTTPAICWSYADGQWWRVDGGDDLDAMRRSAAQRQANTDQGTRGNRQLGATPMQPMPGARFVATDRHGDPACEWRAQQETND